MIPTRIKIQKENFEFLGIKELTRNPLGFVFVYFWILHEQWTLQIYLGFACLDFAFGFQASCRYISYSPLTRISSFSKDAPIWEMIHFSKSLFLFWSFLFSGLAFHFKKMNVKYCYSKMIQNLLIVFFISIEPRFDPKFEPLRTWLIHWRKNFVHSFFLFLERICCVFSSFLNLFFTSFFFEKQKQNDINTKEIKDYESNKENNESSQNRHSKGHIMKK